MKILKFFGVLLVIIVLLVILAFVLLMYMPKMDVSNDVSAWNALHDTYTFLPTSDQLGNYEDLQFKHQKVESFLFNSDSYILKVKYAKEAFQLEKYNVEKTHKFQETAVSQGDNAKKLDASFFLDGFQFTMLSLEEYKLDFPNCFAFIGINEETRTICYVFYSDPDLEHIGSGFDEFLVKECGW